MSHDNSATEILSISVRRDGARMVIALAGELDHHGAHRLDDVLHELLVAPVDCVEVDATALTFVDSSGLRSILMVRAKADDIGATFRVSTGSPVVERVISIAGLAGQLLVADPVRPAGKQQRQTA